MKRKFLEDLGLEKEVIDQILDENTADIGREKKFVEEKQAEVDSLQSRLDEVQQKLSEFEGVDIAELNEKIGNLTQELKNKDEAYKTEIAQKDYGYAVEAAVSALKFSSTGAKKAFITDLKEKGLKLEKDSLLGFSDYVDEYKKNDPGAFVEEKETPPPYAAGTGTQQMQNNDTSKMTYSEMCAYMEKNPNTKI